MPQVGAVKSHGDDRFELSQSERAVLMRLWFLFVLLKTCLGRGDHFDVFKAAGGFSSAPRPWTLALGAGLLFQVMIEGSGRSSGNSGELVKKTGR